LSYLNGVDLSKYQWFTLPNGHPDLSRPVDFQKMKDAGVSFAFVRATTIYGAPDYAFEENWAGLKSVGIPRGAYGFANQNDPVGFAEKMYDVVSLTGDLGELPPAMDYERMTLTFQATYNFLTHLQSLFQKRPLIYTNYNSWFKSPPPWNNDFPHWVANYTEGTQPKWMPVGWKDWLFWQHAVRADGFDYGVKSQEIDHDYFQGDQALFDATFNLKPAPTLQEQIDDLRARVERLEAR